MDVFIKTTCSELRSVLELLPQDTSYAERHHLKDDGNEIITFGAVYVLDDLGIAVYEGTYYDCDNEDSFGVTLINGISSVDHFEFDEFEFWSRNLPLQAITEYLEWNKHGDIHVRDGYSLEGY